MDQAEIESTAEQPSLSAPGARVAAQSAQENKAATVLNPVAWAPSLKFPILEFYTEDPDLWFFQLEATFILNCVTTKKDKYAVVISNLLFKVVRRIPRALATEDKPYIVLKELVVKETDLSDYQRSKKLHALPALGDQRPS